MSSILGVKLHLLQLIYNLWLHSPPHLAVSAKPVFLQRFHSWKVESPRFTRSMKLRTGRLEGSHLLLTNIKLNFHNLLDLRNPWTVLNNASKPIYMGKPFYRPPFLFPCPVLFNFDWFLTVVFVYLINLSVSILHVYVSVKRFVTVLKSVINESLLTYLLTYLLILAFN